MMIVFEGIDGCGKNTNITLLQSEYEFEVIKFPRDKYSLLTDFLHGKIEISRKALFLLFLSDIMDGISKVSDEKPVFLDRYFFSTIAYEVNGIEYDTAKQIISSLSPPKPDAVILLDISPEISMERKIQQKGLDRYERDVEYLTKVRGNFLKLYKEKFYTPNWFLIDGNRPIMHVYEDVKATVEKLGIRKS
ncbi:MAG: dTMP kinase [Candidatus Micrarchaeia archaeon]